MNPQTNTGIDEREEWRTRIMRALKELRSDESSVTRGRHEETRDESAGASAKL
jgi:hypothetical protein